MSVIAGVSYAALATREKLQGGIGKANVKRYWPGKAPKWAGEAVEEDEVNVFNRAFPNHDGGLVVDRKDDPRLRRLAKTRNQNREQVRAEHHRQVREAEIIFAQEEEVENQETKDQDEDDGAVQERRERIKEKMLKRAQEEAELLPVEEEHQEVEEEEESEYQSDESDTPGRAVFEPLFVPKAERNTVAQREKLEAREKALEELAIKKLETRKKETKQLVVEEVRKDQEITKNKLLEEADIGDVDTDDEANEAEEYEAWRTRESARIKRERDEKEAMLGVNEEVKKLRKMTEKERRVWEKENPQTSSASASAKRKTKWKFMQRYYHKGAFYQEDDIFQRDFSAPTGEDRFDKSKLRQVLQVKKFGHSGRTKWTHLVNEDTTKRDPWTSSDHRRDEYIKMMSG